MSKKTDFVDELRTEFFQSRNALTRLEQSGAQDAHTELIETMKAVTQTLADKREKLLAAIEAPKKAPDKKAKKAKPQVELGKNDILSDGVIDDTEGEVMGSDSESPIEKVIKEEK